MLIDIEEAIKILEKDKALCLFNPLTGEKEPMNNDCKLSAVALEMAIEALKNQQKKEAEDELWDACYECRGYGDDYYINASGELVGSCDNCWVTKARLELDDQ